MTDDTPSQVCWLFRDEVRVVDVIDSEPTGLHFGGQLDDLLHITVDGEPFRVRKSKTLPA